MYCEKTEEEFSFEEEKGGGEKKAKVFSIINKMESKGC